MALVARTVNVAFAAAANYTLPTSSDILVALKNIGANNIWVAHTPGVTAAVEADECEMVAPGSTIYVLQRPTYNMIAATADTKLNIVNAQGRQ